MGVNPILTEKEQSQLPQTERVIVKNLTAFRNEGLSHFITYMSPLAGKVTAWDERNVKEILEKGEVEAQREDFKEPAKRTEERIKRGGRKMRLAWLTEPK